MDRTEEGGGGLWTQVNWNRTGLADVEVVKSLGERPDVLLGYDGYFWSSVSQSCRCLMMICTVRRMNIVENSVEFSRTEPEGTYR